MDITAVTAKLLKEYETRSALRAFIKSKNEDIKQAEKQIRQTNDELDLNEVQIELLEILIKRPDGIKIEALKRPSVVSFQCGCPRCNPQKAQEPINSPAVPNPTAAAPVKKVAARKK